MAYYDQKTLKGYIGSNYNYIVPWLTPFYKSVESYGGNVAAMKADYRKLKKYGDYDETRKYWDVNPGRHSPGPRGLQGPGNRHEGRYEGAEAQSTWGRSVSGLQYYGIQELTSNIYSQHAAVLKRHWGELEGFKAAGGEEAYYQQQAERKAQAPAKQRAAMRGAEQLRLRSRSASSFLGGGGAGPSPARTAQRSAERERLTARGETSTSGGGVARRRARRGGSYLLQPTGGAREILG